MIAENLSTLKIHKLTEKQYNCELANGNIDPTALYLTPDEYVDLSIYATKEDLNNKSDASHTHNYNAITNKPSFFDAKAIKSITRSGTTFTYTCMDGTTGTFTQQDNDTIYDVVTTSANGLMSATDKIKLNAMELSTVSEVKDYLAI